VLLRFRVANYASIRDEAELSAVAVTEHQDIATRPVPDAGVSVLPAVAIYGPNASGKSNVLAALEFMRTAVLDSHQDWRPGGIIDRRPFRLDAASRQRPTTLVVNFTCDDVHYEYGFSVDDRQVTEEWLYSFPKKRTRVLFERAAGQDIKFGPTLTGLRQNIAKLTRPNSLYLSTAAANNHEQLSRIYEWFSDEIFPVHAGVRSVEPYTIRAWKDHDPPGQDALRGLLRYADTGVVDLEIEEQELTDSMAEKARQIFHIISPESTEPPADRNLPPSVSFVHLAESGLARLAMEEESSGTLAWLLLIGPVLEVIRHGGLLLVDELDAYLHPLLTAHLVSLFQDPATNTSGAQLLFNTHDVSLLGPSVPGRLRRDQVWFTEKDNAGATTLTPLSEYRVRDGLENVEKRYLSGRYGAIPFLDDLILESLRDQ
jgi:AAA domain, putative AbiEii toxin, Type IV TA system